MSKDQTEQCSTLIFIDKLTSAGSRPPGINVPSLEQKQYGNWHSAGSHFVAKSSGTSVIGAGAVGEIEFIV